jgi:hypothetical protein
MNNLNQMTVLKSEALQAITKSEIEAQVDTAKKYPRELEKVLKNTLFIATQDKETAESCFYALPRAGKTIRGISVRFAEILTSCWGNIRAGARVIANDGKTITAQGICHDLENNVAVTVEVIRKITDKNGNTFNEDMQIVTSNAACAIALRNAVFKVVPVAITHKIQDQIKDVAMGSKSDFETTKKKAIEHFTKQGIKTNQILSILDKTSIEDINRDDVFTLRGLVQAINDGDTTIQQAFEIKKSSDGLSKAASILSSPPENKTETKIETVPEAQVVSEAKEPVNINEVKEPVATEKKPETTKEAIQPNFLFDEEANQQSKKGKK